MKTVRMPAELLANLNRVHICICWRGARWWWWWMWRWMGWCSIAHCYSARTKGVWESTQPPSPTQSKGKWASGSCEIENDCKLYQIHAIYKHIASRNNRTRDSDGDDDVDAIFVKMTWVSRADEWLHINLFIHLILTSMYPQQNMNAYIIVQIMRWHKPVERLNAWVSVYAAIYV